MKSGKNTFFFRKYIHKILDVAESNKDFLDKFFQSNDLI